jgi:hypothetical protein
LDFPLNNLINLSGLTSLTLNNTGSASHGIVGNIGNLSYMPNLAYLFIQDLQGTGITGTFPSISLLTSISLTSTTNITGSSSNLSSNLTYLYLAFAGTWTGSSISTLSSSLQTLHIRSAGTWTGSINSLPSTLTTLYLYDCGSFTGSLSSLPCSSISSLYIYNCPNITGSVNSFPSTLLDITLNSVGTSPGLTGVIESIAPTSATNINLTNVGNNIRYGGGAVPAWAALTLNLNCYQSPNNVDSFLMAWAGTVGTGTKTITLNYGRTSLSDAAVTTLNSHNKTITVYKYTTAIADWITKSHISLTSYVGDTWNEMVHPSPINIGSAWNGYQYWMAITPYAGTNSIYENPSLFASSDGLNWVIPAGITNPIVPYPGSPYFNADPHLYFENDSLYLFYKLANSTSSKIMLIKSRNSTTWTAPIQVTSTLTGGNEFISPSIQKLGSTYYMYYQKYISPSTYSIARMSSHRVDSVYTNEEAVTLTTVSGSAIWWHLEVKYFNSTWYMAAFATGNRAAGPYIYIAKSSNGTTFTRDDDSHATVFRTLQSNYESVGFYKPSLMFIGTQLYIYYSTDGTTGWQTQYIKAYLQ